MEIIHNDSFVRIYMSHNNIFHVYEMYSNFSFVIISYYWCNLPFFPSFFTPTLFSGLNLILIPIGLSILCGFIVVI